MQEVFEKIVERLEDETEKIRAFPYTCPVDYRNGIRKAIKVVEEVAKEYNNGWISVSERLPADEEIVLMVVKQENGKTRIILQVFYPVLLDTPGIEIKYWQPMPKLPLEYQPKGE